MSSGALSKVRLDRMREVLAHHVEHSDVPGVVALVSRRGETHVEPVGYTTVDGREPMRRDSIFRIASMTKPVTAVATMILVEECKLQLDEPVDRLLPELADRRVLGGADRPLDATVPANRPITVRDLLTFTMGLGIVMGPPGAFPIGDALGGPGARTGPTRARARPRARRVDAPPRHAAARPPARRTVDVQHRRGCPRRPRRPRREPVVPRLPARAHLRTARDARHRVPRAAREDRPVRHRVLDELRDRRARSARRAGRRPVERLAGVPGRRIRPRVHRRRLQRVRADAVAAGSRRPRPHAWRAPPSS